MISTLLAFLHHATAFILFGALMAELVLIRGELNLVSARSLARMDGAYGGAAVVLLIVGFLRVFYTEKGAAYYFGSGPFLVKMVLFAVVGVISIGPTREYLSWRSALRLQQIPVLEDARRRSIRRAIHIQLTLLVAIMLCAALMARGIGLVG